MENSLPQRCVGCLVRASQPGAQKEPDHELGVQSDTDFLELLIFPCVVQRSTCFMRVSNFRNIGRANNEQQQKRTNNKQLRQQQFLNAEQAGSAHRKYAAISVTLAASHASNAHGLLYKAGVGLRSHAEPATWISVLAVLPNVEAAKGPEYSRALASSSGIAEKLVRASFTVLYPDYGHTSLSRGIKSDKAPAPPGPCRLGLGSGCLAKGGTLSPRFQERQEIQRHQLGTSVELVSSVSAICRRRVPSQQGVELEVQTWLGCCFRVMKTTPSQQPARKKGTRWGVRLSAWKAFIPA